MKNYYECHITIQGDPKMIRPMVEGVGWKFSCIDGDPVLGDGVKCCATMLYSKDRGESWVVAELVRASDFLKVSGLKILRRKVEFVIYDDRNALVKCDSERKM